MDTPIQDGLVQNYTQMYRFSSIFWGGEVSTSTDILKRLSEILKLGGSSQVS